MKQSGRLAFIAATLALLSALSSCASAPTQRETTLRDITAQCAALDSAGLRDTTAIYRMDVVTTAAIPSPKNHIPPLGGPGRLVAFSFVVDTFGQPDLCNAWVEKQSDPALGDRFLVAAAGWHFVPATYQGRKVRQLTTIVMESAGAR
ncbi:MAG: hypothetical protein HOQ11_17725 [Gemmatimonadaceae bacterium]|nr:hypothetical protein [Gemmatimonadaceae bacterium]NUQ94695.1 hypothetical protein [Gemmatimonadaceae bacterium]NUR34127.1 hypothetical protein [Gemmatimonadaceae bacterium]NUS99245.1 hypothetical protein [Gemmatimonadaceae bacterium]